MPMTGRPLASSSGAAEWAPAVAAAHRVVVSRNNAESSAVTVRSALGPAGRAPPPPVSRSSELAGPAAGSAPVCGVAAETAAYAVDPASIAATARRAAARLARTVDRVASSAADAITVSTATTYRSGGAHDGVRARRTMAHP